MATETTTTDTLRCISTASLLSTFEYTTGKTDQFTHCASEMAVLHNIWTRGWNSVYRQAPHVLKKDYVDFIHYALAWYACVELHHDGEEERLFPKIEAATGQKGFLSSAVDQHAAFHDGLVQYHDYLLSCTETPESFQPQKLIQIMDSFAPALHQHMSEEPELLLKLSEWDFDVKSMFEQHGKETMSKFSPINILPFLWVNHDTEFEEGLWASWPPAPKPVVWVMRNVLARWNMRWWRFGSCDLQGKPHQLLALREEYRQ